jgi:hypothetical protein
VIWKEDTKMRYIETWLDLPKLGCGVRHAFVVKETKARVRLFFPATCTAYTVPAKAIANATDITPTRRMDAVHLAKVIRDTHKARKRLHVKVNLTEARAVMDDLATVGRAA